MRVGLQQLPARAAIMEHKARGVIAHRRPKLSAPVTLLASMTPHIGDRPACEFLDLRCRDDEVRPNGCDGDAVRDGGVAVVIAIFGQGDRSSR